MKDSPDNKEIAKICGMNACQTAWFLSSSPNNSFEEMFEKNTIYEELQRTIAANKVAKASNNVVINYIPWEGNKKTSTTPEIVVKKITNLANNGVIWMKTLLISMMLKDGLICFWQII